MSVAISPDGTKIVSGSFDKTIKVWDLGAPKSSNGPTPRPKLTLAGLPGRQAGAAEREETCPQRSNHVGGVFPRRDQDCIRIDRRDEQSLGCRFVQPARNASTRRHGLQRRGGGCGVRWRDNSHEGRGWCILCAEPDLMCGCELAEDCCWRAVWGAVPPRGDDVRAAYGRSVRSALSCLEP